ncbi:MAG: helicase-related protein, partial [Spirochaetales bacterium]|nr:helicase-related protein [Spirochaetales bacterium]
QDVFRYLWADEERNQMIAEDVQEAVSSGREILIISERTDHLDQLYDLLAPDLTNLYILKGRMGKKQLSSIMDKINDPDKDESRVILATGKYLGEGVDLPFLDTLFLTFPVSWKGTVAQYAGRLHRDYHDKREVIIYDYYDLKVPVLSRMYEKRLKGYRSLGYEIR